MKKETLAEVFSCEIWNIFTNSILTEHLRTTVSKLKLSLFPYSNFTIVFIHLITLKFLEK